MVIDVYKQFFAAELLYHEVPRRAALVMLISDSEAGKIRYEAAVTFFPHKDEEDYAVSYDAYFSKELYNAKGRRSRKREEALLSTLREEIDTLVKAQDGVVFWDQPLREEIRG